MPQYPHGGKRPVVGVQLPPDLADAFQQAMEEDGAGPTLMMHRALIHYFRHPSSPGARTAELLGRPAGDQPPAEGREGESRVITVRLPEAMYEALEDIERSGGIKRPDLLRQAIAGYLEDRAARKVEDAEAAKERRLKIPDLTEAEEPIGPAQKAAREATRGVREAGRTVKGPEDPGRSVAD